MTTTPTILSLRQRSPAESAELYASCWNNWMREAYGYVPLSAEQINRLILTHQRFNPDGLLFAWDQDQPIGFLHWHFVQQIGYPALGSIPAFAVAPTHRQQGVGRALVAEAVARLGAAGALGVDGSGAWPYSPFYAGLLDGSERSGIFVDNIPARRLLQGAGFDCHCESLVLRRDLIDTPLPVIDASLTVAPLRQPRKRQRFWLDEVFRLWTLSDHILQSRHGSILSRAIYARMRPAPLTHGPGCYAIFGVNTPPGHRHKGWAYQNLARLLLQIRQEGGTCAELHVYADNDPAVTLYKRLGFVEQARTMMLRKKM